MNFENLITGAASTVTGLDYAFLAAYIGIAIFFGLVFYIYSSFVYMTIAKKLNHERPWLAWIPFARSAMLLQLGDFEWQWAFLWLIPFFGWLPLYILLVVSHWRFFEKRNYPGWLGLIQLGYFVPFIGYLAGPAHLVILGMVAWADRK